MSPPRRSRLVVVGAGPKGVALAAKARVLAECGLAAPRVTLVDPAGVAGNWSGEAGYTDGEQRLGTPPEKDVGYPYPAGWGEVSDGVVSGMRRYSWGDFLAATERLGDWVDADRPRPTHARWAEYLRWAADRAGAEVVTERVDRVELDGDSWSLRIGGEDVAADGVVVTGPGPALRLPGWADDPRLLDGASFWPALPGLRGREDLAVCVAGAGETAAAVVTALVDALDRGAHIEVVSPGGMLYTRGESVAENRLYTQPQPGWGLLAERHRREFLTRTDRGVFSVAAQDRLREAEAVHPTPGRVRVLGADAGGVTVRIEDEGEGCEVRFGLVVSAVGFDVMWWERLLGPRARSALHEALGVERLGSRAVEAAIGDDLAVTGLAAPLHLPMLAGLAQGPGFPNLSCLGLLSDRVLRRHTRTRTAAAAGTARVAPTC